MHLGNINISGLRKQKCASIEACRYVSNERKSRDTTWEKTVWKPSIDNFDLERKKKPMQKYRFMYVIHETVERTSHWLDRIIREIEKNGNAIKML